MNTKCNKAREAEHFMRVRVLSLVHYYVGLTQEQRQDLERQITEIPSVVPQEKSNDADGKT